VESNQIEKALIFGRRLKPIIKKRESAAEKYATALRANGQFEEAMQFLIQAKEAGLESKALAIQFVLARQGNRSIRTPKLNS
jgi:hypothetical protein